MLKLILNAVPIEHKNNTQILALYAVRLPNVAAIGAQNKDDEPITSSTPALHTFMRSLVVCRVEAISGSAGKRQVLLNVAANVIQETVKRIMDFRQLGRWWPGGSSGAGSTVEVSEVDFVVGIIAAVGFGIVVLAVVEVWSPGFVVDNCSILTISS